MDYGNTCGCEWKQAHVHEYEGSTKRADKCDLHCHRFAGISGPAIYQADGCHYHKIETATDYFDNHFHIICDKTGPAIPVSCERHVHYVCGLSSESDGHCHKFEFATLIENPSGC
ncbi:MAG: YmaF family protein [Eubacteriales bacterium]